MTQQREPSLDSIASQTGARTSTDPVPSDNHYFNFLECVRTRREPVAPVDAGHQASCLGNVTDVALRLGRKVTWDPAAVQFVGDDEANRLRSRAMREPWSL